MTRATLGMVVLAWAFAVSPSFAQPRLPGAKDATKDRLPNDQIEGTVFEYYATKQKKAEGGEVKELKGKFRLEETAIFDVSPRLSLPSKKEVEKKVIDPIRRGDALNVRLPEGPQQKRLGEYKKISGGKLRLDFNDKDSLHGIMIIQKKKETDNVWIGTYSERVDNKVVAEWNVEVRPIED